MTEEMRAVWPIAGNRVFSVIESQENIEMCPFVDSGHARCAVCMTLRNLTRAFVLCADRYTECPIYRERVAHGRKHQPCAAIAFS